MAQRRMFSKQVVQSSKFLRMPVSSRLLYYDLGMAADDDGYCEWYPVLLSSGAKEQDLQLLHANELIFIFDKDVLVVKDWKTNNFIRPDRYTPSKYLGRYEKTTGTPLVYQVATSVVPQDRLEIGESHSGAVAPIEVVLDKPNPDLGYKEVFNVFSPRKQGWMMHSTQVKAAKRLLADRGLDQIHKAMAFYKEYEGEPYMVEIHTPFDLEAKWARLFKKKETYERR